MGNVERKMLLAYVNAIRPISFYDKELHRDFFYFKLILEEECHFFPDLEFQLEDGYKGKTRFEQEPFCQSIELLILEMIRRGWLTFVKAGTIQITKEGYLELRRLCKIVDPMVPSVRYMVSRLKDYREMYGCRVRELNLKENKKEIF